MLQHSSTVSHKNPAGQARMMIQKPGRVIAIRFEPGPPGAVVSNVPATLPVRGEGVFPRIHQRLCCC